jgi:hypothetical protein
LEFKGETIRTGVGPRNVLFLNTVTFRSF